MKKSSKGGEEESGRNQELIQKWRILEKEWETLKKGKLPNTRRFSTGSDSSSLINFFDQLLENSPRGLMYSLQRRRSPSDGFLRRRSCDMAVEEVVRERRAAIVSGKLKGRRLFRQAEAASEVELDLNYDDCGGGGDCGGWLNVVGEGEVGINENSERRKGRRGDDELHDAIPSSCSFSDASLSEEKAVVAEEKVVVEKRRDGGDSGAGGGRCIVTVAWLVFLLILLIFGLISMSCNGKSVHENDLILVPT